MITVAFLIVWGIAAALVGCIVGRSIHAADRPQHTSPYDDANHDLMALVQAESWAQAERDLRAIERSWWA